MEHVSAWPWQTALAIAQLMALVFWGPLTKARRWLLQSNQTEERQASAELGRLLGEITRLTARVSDLEDLVDLLRKALDKHLIRESAIRTAAELLIAMIEQAPNPTDAMLRIRDRAVEILEQARTQLQQINQGGRA
jgi:hypothetical protein